MEEEMPNSETASSSSNEAESTNHVEEQILIEGNIEGVAIVSSKTTSSFEKENTNHIEQSKISSAFLDTESTNITSETAKEIDESSEIENFKKIEAALFLSARFLNLQELVLLTDINPLMLKELLEQLIAKYNQDDSAIEIIEKENMWKMDVCKEHVGMINKLATGSSEFSKTEQETLAVIAYKQPVKQSVIINIRGNKAYDHVKKFIDIGLVQAKRLGHTKELRLSDDFYEYFHLQNQKILDDHPDFESSEKSGDLQKKDDGSEIPSLVSRDTKSTENAEQSSVKLASSFEEESANSDEQGLVETEKEGGGEES